MVRIEFLRTTGGLTKRERWFGGCGPSRPSWCRVPRICAIPHTGSCFFQACAWQPARRIEERRTESFGVVRPLVVVQFLFTKPEPRGWIFALKAWG